MTAYVGLIHKDPDSDYGVSFPDLPGCVSAGSTLDEAIAMAKEALALHIEGLLEDKGNVPAPSALDQIDRDDALLVAAIEVPDNLKVERINVTIPALALQRFDAFAERHSMTRSGLLVEATQRWIADQVLRPSPISPRFAPHRLQGLNDTLETAPMRMNPLARVAEQTPMKPETRALQAQLDSLEHGREQLSEDWALENLSERILWLTQELEKALRTFMERRVAPQPVYKDRP